jgi:hypothetical protein
MFFQERAPDIQTMPKIVASSDVEEHLSSGVSYVLPLLPGSGGL